ncbi:MAG: aminoacyl-tRNA hydrolase [Prolixibacteraceae bacterium]|nr:aminoacyl-tRNA hydrolase [Prolixibacteraceae bacterium]
MRISEERRNRLLDEFKFTSSRSSGPGGQNVNKVNSRIELHFNLEESDVFSADEKHTIKIKLANRINSEGEIFLASGVERSQWQNKERVIQRFFELVEKALTPRKKRIKTEPTQASKIKRLDGKKQLSLKKQIRKKPEL